MAHIKKLKGAEEDKNEELYKEQPMIQETEGVNQNETQAPIQKDKEQPMIQETEATKTAATHADYGEMDHDHKVEIVDPQNNENEAEQEEDGSEDSDNIYSLSVSESYQNKALNAETTDGVNDQKAIFHGTKGDYYDDHHHALNI
eukprot:584781_1